MKIEDKIQVINKKKIPVRICGNENSEYIFILNHGVLSKKESFRPLEKMGGDKYLYVSFDARGNEGSSLKPSRFTSKYVNDLRDIVLWVKERYLNKKIVVIGSSWGAAIVLEFAKKYNTLVHKIVGWSIPHRTFGSDNYNNGLKNSKNKKDSSSLLYMIFAFLIMFLTNINTYIKIKIDHQKTTTNKLLIRMGRMKKYDLVSTRYIWVVWKSLIGSIKKVKNLNKKSKVKILYIQSLHDSYGDNKVYEFLKENTGNRVDYLLANEFFHALHWEKSNYLDKRMFDTIIAWVKKGELKLERCTTVATHTNKKLKFSFIVAAYNVEKYIHKCIKSLLTNSTNDYEIIIVDDKSTDSTMNKINEFKSDKRIRIIKHSSNLGVSAARNTGIENAKGEWYIFIDGDDYISSNFLFNIKPHLDDTHNFYIYKINKDVLANKHDLKVQAHKMNDSIVSRVINNSLFDNYRFPAKFHYGIEDWDFYVHQWMLFKAKNITLDTNIWYHYTYNSDSLSKSPNVYSSRLKHAISIYENTETREVALTYKIYGHYYIHLLLMSEIWFPKLKNDVKKIKYKQRKTFIIWIQYWCSKIPFIKNKIRKLRKAIDK